MASIPTPPLTSALAVGMKVLLEARTYADQSGLSLWEFAVEIRTFTTLGLTGNDLRWLIHHGYAAHAQETTLLAAGKRSFAPLSNYALPDNSCLVLTDGGLELARQLGLAGVPVASVRAVSPANVEPLPFWDPRLRELRVGAIVVKRFRQPAVRQETILAAFQEEEWPYRIDDPLPPQSGRSARRHLHDTINNLNRNQQQRLLQFSGDGQGEGICWRLLHQSHTTATPPTLPPGPDDRAIDGYGSKSLDTRP